MKRPRPVAALHAGRETLHPITPTLLLAAGSAIIVALHLLRPDVQPAWHYISEYGNEAWGWLLSVALVLIALGLLSLASVLRDTLGARTAPRLMRVSGAMLAVAALFSTDRVGGEVELRTLPGRIHGLASIGAFCLLVLAMAALSPRFEGDGKRLGRSSELALPLLFAGLAIVTVAFLFIPEADGLRQRAFLVIVFGWLLATAWQIRSLRAPGSGAGEPTTSRQP